MAINTHTRMDTHMSLTPYMIIFILVITLALFIWGRWRYDVVAMLALMFSTLVGAVPFNDVYSGLDHPAVITVACVMVISKAITRSGILNVIVRRLNKFTASITLHVASLTTITAVFSAFMNNVGALALMMPIAIQSALANKRSPSLLLMPLAIGSALGGLTTMIGTPPNLLVSGYRLHLTGQAFTMFDFSYVGLGVAIVGVFFISFIGWRLIPGNRRSQTGSGDRYKIDDYVTELNIPDKSPYVGKSIKHVEQAIKGRILILGLIRESKKFLVLPRDMELQAGDILIVEAESRQLEELLAVTKLQLVGDQKIDSDILRSNTVGLMEAVVAPGSSMEGHSSVSNHIRRRFQLNLLAIARRGRRFRKRLHHVKWQAGDVVLLQGPSEILRENIVSLGLLPLEERGLSVGVSGKAYLPLIIFMGAIVVTVMQWLPVQLAFGGAVLLMVLMDVMPIRSIYECIDWPIIILLAAMIPIGNALQSTGGTGLIAHYFVELSGHISPLYILVIFLVVTMTLSDVMNNAATTVVMSPIAVSIAQALKLNVDPFLMAVALGASCSFLTPVGHQNNTLVMGPGGYRFSDYIKLGLPLEILILLTGVPLILWAWPLN